MTTLRPPQVVSHHRTRAMARLTEARIESAQKRVRGHKRGSRAREYLKKVGVEPEQTVMVRPGTGGDGWDVVA